VTDPLTDVTGLSAPRVAVVLGSGLSGLARRLVPNDPVPYSAIAGMPASSVPGHEGSLYYGEIERVRALIFAGRVHLYEGHDAGTVTWLIRAAAAAGCDIFVLTNAAGSLNPAVEAGTPCLISDHLNLTGTNPLIGPNDDSAGPRFLDLTEVYDRELRTVARSVDPALNEGVYAGLVGPTYETPAEIQMLKTLGADLVGMSTVLEAIQARHLGRRVLGISIATNLAAGLADKPLSHDEVADAGRSAAARLEKLLRGVIAKLA
jgi:purine-nucleoside phosphorylase